MLKKHSLIRMKSYQVTMVVIWQFDVTANVKYELFIVNRQTMSLLFTRLSNLVYKIGETCK